SIPTATSASCTGAPTSGPRNTCAKRIIATRRSTASRWQNDETGRYETGRFSLRRAPRDDRCRVGRSTAGCGPRPARSDGRLVHRSLPARAEDGRRVIAAAHIERAPGLCAASERGQTRGPRRVRWDDPLPAARPSALDGGEAAVRDPAAPKGDLLHLAGQPTPPPRLSQR